MLKLKLFVVCILINLIVLQDNSDVHTEETIIYTNNQTNPLENGSINQENGETQNIDNTEEKVKEIYDNQQQIEQRGEEIIPHQEELTSKEPQIPQAQGLQKNNIEISEQNNVQENTEKIEPSLNDLPVEGIQLNEENVIENQNNDFAQNEKINNDLNRINIDEKTDNGNLNQQLSIESQNKNPTTHTIEKDNNNGNIQNQINNNNAGNNYNSEVQSNHENNDNIEYVTQEEAATQVHSHSIDDMTQHQNVDEANNQNSKDNLDENNTANKDPIINVINEKEVEQIMPENESHHNSENDLNKKHYFSNEKINKVIVIFEKYLIKVHSDIKTYIPYPYDLIFFSILGYFCIWLICCGQRSSISLKKPKTVTDQNVFIIDKVNIYYKYNKK